MKMTGKCFIIIMTAALAFSLAACKKDANRIIVLSKMGKASLNVPGNELKVKAELKVGDKIITGKSSMVQILLAKDSAVKIYENTEFTITKRLLGEDGSIKDSQLDLKKGKLMTLFGKLSKDSSMKIKTPTAVASVRGTTFVIAVNEGADKIKIGATELKVVEGKVYIQTADKPQEARMVEKGEKITLANDKIIEDKKPIAEKELNSLRIEEEQLVLKITVESGEKSGTGPGDPKKIEEKTVTVELTTNDAIEKRYNKLEEVNLDDGTKLIGAIIYQDEYTAKVHTTQGIVEVPVGSINSVIMR